MLTLHKGYDVRYLTDAVGEGGSRYYTDAAGEPPGRWYGRGAAALGLAGDVDGDVMSRLYHDDVAPDGTVLAKRQRTANYPGAPKGSVYKQVEEAVERERQARHGIMSPETERDLRLRLRAQVRNVVPFLDFTNSVPKTVSVLWASLRAAAKLARDEQREADAEQLAERARAVERAVRSANERLLTLIEQKTAYVRTGHHSKVSGEWRDADGLVIASFFQHTNRDGDPQLHHHNAIANRAQRADKADEKWRTLYGRQLFHERLGLGALGERILAQELGKLGYRMVLRADGNSLEVGGIPEEAAAAYSDRSKDTAAEYRKLAAKYAADHGHAPDKRAAWALRQQAAQATREPKHHTPADPDKELTDWAAKAERRDAGKLAALHEAADRFAAEHGPSEMPGEAERERAARIAVAEVTRISSTWPRSKLLMELHRALPPLPPDVDPVPYLEGLADEILAGRIDGARALQVAPVADVIDVSRLGQRKDGGSIYRPTDEERFTTEEHVSHENWLLDAARIPVLQAVSEAEAEAALAGMGLDYSQHQAARGLLTTQRLITCLVAPPGTGKTHTMGRYAAAWTKLTGGRVIGLTLGQNAARVMAEHGMTETYNIARFLGKIKDSDKLREHVPVRPGDVLVLDEASQIGTLDLLHIVQIARRRGALVVAVGDTEQLGSPEAGGMFALLAKRYGNWKLTEVRRFREAWERAASLKLRDGDITALAAYNGHGRIWHGPQDRMQDEAVTFYLADRAAGKDTLLLAPTNEEAARLSRLARERLIERGELDAGGREVTLSDGNRAGVGDELRARLNTKIDADGQPLTNRDVFRITGWQGPEADGYVIAERKTAEGWSAPFLAEIPYLRESAELAYAGNVHVAEGMTVDTGHLVAGEGIDRKTLLTGATRGAEKNTIYVKTGPPDPDAMIRQEREAYTREAIKRAGALLDAGETEAALAVNIIPPETGDRQQAPWEAVLAGALAREDPPETATEQIEAAQDFVTHTGHLLTIAEAGWWQDVVPLIDEAVRARIPEADYRRYMADPERPAFLQTVREHEIGGRPVEDLLDAITARPLDGLRSIAAGLHGRAGKEPAPVRGKTETWTERAPQAAPRYVREAYQAAGGRQAALGEELAAAPPEWALSAWGDPRAKSGAELADWKHRAAAVQSYREATGITNPAQAIGPVPSGRADLHEAFRTSVRLLELPDETALLRAMGRGELEAQVREHERARAAAPPDVTRELDTIDRAHAFSRDQARDARAEGEESLARSADTLAGQLDTRLGHLRVADAKRAEWAEAHADLEAKAAEALAELQRRNQERDRSAPITDAKVKAAEREPRETPALTPEEAAQIREAQAQRAAEIRENNRTMPEAETEMPVHIDPALHAAERAEWDAQIAALRERNAAAEDASPAPEHVTAERYEEAQREAERREAIRAAMHEALASEIPVTEEEIGRYLPEAGDDAHVDPGKHEAGKAAQSERAAEARSRTLDGPQEPEPGRVDPGKYEQQQAAQTARVDAERQARHEAAARLMPVTDAEIEEYGDIFSPEARQQMDAISERTEAIAAQAKAAERAAARDEARREAGINEPLIHAGPEADLQAEAAWEPGTSADTAEPPAAPDPAPQAEAEAELEIG